MSIPETAPVRPDLGPVLLSQAAFDSLVAENEEMRRDLAAYIAGSVTIENLTTKYGHVDMALGGHVIAMVARMMVDWFDDAGGDNYVEVRLLDRKSAKAPREFVLTMQRADGKTPHELRDEALALTRALRDALKPFAAWAGSFSPDEPDELLLGSGVNKDGSANTVGDLRRARALLERIQE